ncbi:hypothetical protein pb186bvf_020535 [Paramecium bursaria]
MKQNSISGFDKRTMQTDQRNSNRILDKDYIVEVDHSFTIKYEWDEKIVCQRIDLQFKSDPIQVYQSKGQLLLKKEFQFHYYISQRDQKQGLEQNQ